ncbi:unnamed protein product, partial [Didymodactylos carnosus]
LVNEDKIAYKEQDGISYNMVYGYKTLFAYYYEHEQGKISKSSLEENISIGIHCGSFSYAETPLRFHRIMGVTGTLETLSIPERDIVEKIYHIQKSTYMPSVFGANNRHFAKDVDTLIEDTSFYFKRIVTQINNMINVQRAVLVFFESRSKLNEFYHSDSLAPIKDKVLIITEEISSKDKEMFVKRATTSGQVTLLTREFGRGTDFVCNDQTCGEKGGVHVIQTFLSEELSEETQIMGRTARQGKQGSYSIVILDKDLEKFLISEADVKRMNESGIKYETLNQKRNDFFKEQYVNSSKYVEGAKKEHNEGQKFVESLNQSKIQDIKAFLGERNRGAGGNSQSRTICLMDATGSMSHLLHKAKNTVGTMFERASVVLKENGIPPDCFQMQFVVYRNYNSKEDEILQTSPWETKADNLRAFMDRISAKGGWSHQTEEAIEIGFSHANEENKKENISQVILIGDAAANTKEQVRKGRENKIHGGEKYWETTKFKEPTFYANELEKLKNKTSKKIPVHAFFVHKQAKRDFQEIATQTGGRCEELDINSPKGAQRLTDLVTEEVLRNVGSSIGGNEGRGNALVEAYRKKFGKGYKA